MSRAEWKKTNSVPMQVLFSLISKDKHLSELFLSSLIIKRFAPMKL